MSTRPKALDLFCGASGASMGLHRAGFDVTGVDIKPQPRYPFRFVQGDALTFPCSFVGGSIDAWPEICDRCGRPFDHPCHEKYDFIWASPPCQAYSDMRVMKNAGKHPALITPVRERLQAAGVPWVIENVEGAPLKVGPPGLFTDTSGIILCGSMFGLRTKFGELRRHRLFESSIPLRQPRCEHGDGLVIGFYGDHARKRRRSKDGGDICGKERKLALVRDLMGIDWMEWHEATQAIPPAYGEFIGRQIIGALGYYHAN